ncbi:hypothetical protein OY671_011884, partial [Metschnikowia pulcherrima]
DALACIGKSHPRHSAHHRHIGGCGCGFGPGPACHRHAVPSQPVARHYRRRHALLRPCGKTQLCSAVHRADISHGADRRHETSIGIGVAVRPVAPCRNPCGHPRSHSRQRGIDLHHPAPAAAAIPGIARTDSNKTLRGSAPGRREACAAGRHRSGSDS